MGSLLTCFRALEYIGEAAFIIISDDHFYEAAVAVSGSIIVIGGIVLAMYLHPSPPLTKKYMRSMP